MMPAVNLTSLERSFPAINWRTPVQVAWAEEKITFACRVCIAAFGLKFDSPHQWPTSTEAQKHIDVHIGEATSNGG